MTPAEAAALLELPSGFTPEQVEARYQEMRARLEDRIAKAPTPGLKEKYRASLAETTKAYETLVLAADTSSLPVSRRDPAAAPAPTSTPTSASPGPAPRQAARRPSQGREFTVVVAVATIMLAAGGWWAMNTRAENAEKARAAEVAAAEAAKQKAREAAEAAEEKARELAEAKAAQARTDRKFAQLKGALAEHRIAWDVVEAEERTSAQRLSELKSDLRGLRDGGSPERAELQARVAAQEAYHGWLAAELLRHPAKVARAKAEEFLASRQLPEAEAAVAELGSALAGLDQAIAGRKVTMLAIEGDAEVVTNSDAEWRLRDALGRIQSGKGPAKLKAVAFGPGSVEFKRAEWPDLRKEFRLAAGKPAVVDGTYPKGHTLVLLSDPVGAEVTSDDGKRLGATPLTLHELPPKTFTVTYSAPGYFDRKTTYDAGTADGEQAIVKLERGRRLRVTYRGSSESDYSNYTGGFVDEWDFSKDAVAKRISNVSDDDGKYVPTNSVRRYVQQADGTWKGAFQEGAPAEDASLIEILMPSFAPPHFLVPDNISALIPSGKAQVGMSYAVPIRAIGYRSEKRGSTYIRRSGTAKATVTEISPARDIVTVLVEYEVSWSAGDGVDGDDEGTQKYRINVDTGTPLEMDWVVEVSSSSFSTKGRSRYVIAPF